MLAIDDALDVYLIRNFTYASNQYTLHIAGGAMDEGETPEQAAQRELEEEL